MIASIRSLASYVEAGEPHVNVGVTGQRLRLVVYPALAEQPAAQLLVLWTSQ